jgi:quinol monooxygenase YgiN
LITGSANPKPQHREALIQAAQKITSATQSDQGCVFYDFSLSLDGSSVNSVEIWDSQEALDAHMEHEHTVEFMSGLGDIFITPPSMTQTEIKS